MSQQQSQLLLFTLTDYINRNKKHKNQILQNIRYKYDKPDDLQLENMPSMQATFKQSGMPSKAQQSRLSCAKVSIDKQACLVNDKIVVLRQQQDQIGKDRKKLMRLLRQNKIAYKQYILGDKTKYLDLIRKNQAKKRQQAIKGYFRNHMNREKAAKVEVASDFQQNKANLFSTK